MKLSELYSEYFANWISDGNMISRDKISLLGIRPLYDRYLTNQWITKVWIVASVPVHYDLCLTQLIREEMHSLFPKVKTVVHLYNDPINVRVNTETFKRQLHAASSRYDKYNSYFQSLNADEQITGVTEMDPNSGAKISIDSRTLKNIKNERDSYLFVYDSVNAGKEFHNTYYFVQASSKSKSEMQRYDRTLMKLFQEQGIVAKRVRGNISNYLENFCPASYKQFDVSRFPTMLLSEENIAALLPNKTKGLIGRKGVMLGEDVETHLPAMIDFTGSGTAQVILIVGEAGSGKTYVGTSLANELTAFGIHCSVIDIKGGEWNALSKYIRTLEIDMSGTEARFVNLMRLDDLGCTAEDCVEAYESAISSTVGLFEVATNLQPNEGNQIDLRSILNQAVEKVYSTAGVIKSNPTTFNLTRRFKYEDVLEIISSLEHSKAYTEGQRLMCKLVKSRCAQYFVGEGRYSAAFQNELTVSDVLSVPLVIYNFNKNRGEKLDIIDDIRVFMARCLDSRKHFVRKKQKLHQAVFYEELQRCGNMQTLIENISSDVTGSRSNNLTVFLLLNAISTLDTTQFSAIRSNITTRIVGKVNSADIRKLVQDYDCSSIENYLDCIHENEDGRYEHCFAMKYDTGNDRNQYMFRTIMPKDMQEQLNTRDIFELGG